MPVLTLFSGVFCNEGLVIEAVVTDTKLRLLTDRMIASEASKLSGIAEDKIVRAFSGKTSLFNKFTHEKERAIAYLRLALAAQLSSDHRAVVGCSGHLIPKEISHVLRVCLIADLKFRVAAAMKEKGISEDEARKLIRREDEDCAAWISSVLNKRNPWDASLYDMVIPTNKMSSDEIARSIITHLNAGVVQATDLSRKAVDNFLLAARVEAALAQEGHSVGVTAHDGAVTLTINKHVLLLSRLEEELRTIARQVSGVRAVEIKVGPAFYQADIYRRYDFEVPSKVLLVDDEREFVQTLSERLMMRDLGTAVAYDGESALEVVKEDEPEVMILDLRMPGIDGIEVLRKVKSTQPDIEVIILTGHGSEADRETCMKLGAFAYLQKPVDIDELNRTIKRAYEQLARRRQDKQ